MTKEQSQVLRKKNRCSTCERRGNYKIGCQTFSEEPENCWAWTDDKDWLRKAEEAIKGYSGGKR